MGVRGTIQHRNGVILSIDSLGLHILGCSFGKIFGKSIYEFLDKEGSNAVRRAMNEKLREEFELFVNKKDGSKVLLKIYPDFANSPLFGIREEIFEIL